MKRPRSFSFSFAMSSSAILSPVRSSENWELSSVWIYFHHSLITPPFIFIIPMTKSNCGDELRSKTASRNPHQVLHSLGHNFSPTTNTHYMCIVGETADDIINSFNKQPLPFIDNINDRLTLFSIINATGKVVRFIRGSSGIILGVS